MKLKSHHIHARIADMGSADSETAGLSMKGSVTPEKTAIACAISRYFSARYIFPVISCAVPGMVFAGPEGGQVVAGTATISNPGAGGTLITQTTERAAIDWQRFNIGAQEYVQFVQPDANSVALNRVIGGDPSQILGNLSANGQVFLVNPHGIYFGHTATVDVGGLVASVNDIHNEDFLSGNYVFSKRAGSPEDAGVVNDGVIRAHDGGYVVLMGDNVQNNGIISARLGTVALAAGNQITMDVKSNGLVSIAIDEEALSGVAGVENTGEIMAAGGRVMMTAKVANDLIDTAINNEGLVVANSITEHNGVIFLAAAGGDVVNSGTLDASAEDGSNVDGGGVLVYSDKDIINESGARISATGDGSGDGGVVRVIAEDRLDHQSGALIDVTSDEGKGGFVEVSGHGSLAIRGYTDIGTGGELLIDPDVLLIRNTGGASLPSFSTGTTFIGLVDKGYIESQLNSNVNVTLVANNDINAGAGTLGGATFTLNATGLGDLSIVNGLVTSAVSGTLGFCSLTGVCLPGGSNGVLPSSTGNINLGSVSFNIAGGLSVSGGTAAGTVALGGISAGGDVSITAGGSVTLNSNTITAGGNVTLAGDIGSTASLRTADLTINAGSDINIQSDIYLANNNLVLAADTDANGAGDVNITGSTTDDLTIKTSALMSVTGANFNVKGADFGTGSVSADTTGSLTPVTIQTDRLTANVSNQVVISGGRVNVVDSNNSTAGGRDVSVSVIANSDIDINATDLIVRGDSITANGTSFSTFITANGNATLSAGNDINIDVSGDLTVAGGVANATASIYSSGSANALANAAINAGGNVNITNVGGALTIKAGPAGASMNSVVSGTGSAVAEANANISGTNITVGNAGSLNVHRGKAGAVIQSFSSGNYSATASANAALTATQAVNLSVTGNINLTGGTGASSNTASVSANSNGGPGVYNVTANANTSIQGTNVTINSANGGLTLAAGNASASATSSGTNITHTMKATAITEINASGDVSIDVAGDVSMAKGAESATSASPPNVIAADASAMLSAGALNMTAGGNISGNGVDVSANGLYMSAGNNIDLVTSNLLIGNGTVANISGDATTLAFMAANGIKLPTTANPNAKFSAGGTLSLGTLTMDGDVPYLWLKADNTSINSLTLPTATDVVVQYSPFTLTASIGVEDLPDTSEVVNYNNLEHFGILPGTTVIIGSSMQTGAINIGNLGKLDIGTQNMVVVTASSITTIDNVISTGIVAELLVGQFDFDDEFVTPVLSEVEVGLLPVDDPTDEKEKKKKLIKDDENEIKMCEAG